MCVWLWAGMNEWRRIHFNILNPLSAIGNENSHCMHMWISHLAKWACFSWSDCLFLQPADVTLCSEILVNLCSCCERLHNRHICYLLRLADWLSQGQLKTHKLIIEGAPAELIGVDYVLGACGAGQSWMPVAHDSYGVHGHSLNKYNPVRPLQCFHRSALDKPLHGIRCRSCEKV